MNAPRSAETMPIDRHLALRIDMHCRSIVLLNLGEDADEELKATRDTMSRLLSYLGTEYLEELYILGNRAPYALSAFSNQLHQWRHQNRHRASLVRPILESKSPDDLDYVIIVTHRIPYDLDDYDCSAWRDRIVLLPVANELVDNKDEWGYSRASFRCVGQVEDLLELKDSVRQVAIKSTGVMPYYWSNSGFRWDGDGLVAEELEDYECILSALVPSGTTVSARVTYESGRIVPALALKPASAPEIPELSLTPQETSIVTACLENHRYNCPVCGKQHTRDVVRCQHESASEGWSDLLGTLVFRQLDSRIQRDGRLPCFLLIVLRGEIVVARPIWSRVLRVAPNLVAVRHEWDVGCAQIHAYDSHQGIWQPRSRYLEQYESISPNVFAVVL